MLELSTVNRQESLDDIDVDDVRQLVALPREAPDVLAESLPDFGQ
jgi:hypothetical protein